MPVSQFRRYPMADVSKAFIEREMTEEEFAKLPDPTKQIVIRYGIPIPASSSSKRKFKLTRHWYSLAFPKDFAAKYEKREK
jgi:hypothetical protein